MTRGNLLKVTLLALGLVVLFGANANAQTPPPLDYDHTPYQACWFFMSGEIYCDGGVSIPKVPPLSDPDYTWIKCQQDAATEYNRALAVCANINDPIARENCEVLAGIHFESNMNYCDLYKKY